MSAVVRHSKAPRSRSRRRTPIRILDDTHSFSIDTTGTKGIVTDNGNGTFSYDPNGAFNLALGTTATDTFNYTVKDGSERLIDGDGDDHHHRGTEQAPVANNIASRCAGEWPGGYRSRRPIPISMSATATASRSTTPAPKVRSSTTVTARFSYDPDGVFTSLKAGATGDRHVQIHRHRRLGRFIDGDGDHHHHRSKMKHRSRPDASSANAQEIGPAAYRSTASYTDVDDGDTHTFSIDTTGTKGRSPTMATARFSYDPNGAFTSLKAGATATDTFNVHRHRRFECFIDRDGDRHYHRRKRSPGRDRMSRPTRRRSVRRLQVTASYTDVDVGDTHTFSIDTTGTKGLVIDNGNGTLQLRSERRLHQPEGRRDRDRHVPLHGHRRLGCFVDGDGDRHHHRRK